MPNFLLSMPDFPYSMHEFRVSMLYSLHLKCGSLLSMHHSPLLKHSSQSVVITFSSSIIIIPRFDTKIHCFKVYFDAIFQLVASIILHYSPIALEKKLASFQL